MERRSYTKEQREAAVSDVRTLGVNGAATKHGVPQSSVSRWAAQAGVVRGAGAPPSSTPSAGKPRAPKSKPGVPVEPKVESPRSIESKGEDPATVLPPTSAATRRTLKSRVAKLYTPSEKAVILEDAAKDGPTEAATKHGVSRYSI